MGGDSGGEAASLREAPLPQTPSPEEQLAFEVRLFSCLVPPASWARLRYAGLSPRRLTEPPRTCGVREEHVKNLMAKAIGFRPLTKSSTVFSNGKKQEKGKATSNK